MIYRIMPFSMTLGDFKVLQLLQALSTVIYSYSYAAVDKVSDDLEDHVVPLQ